MISGIRRLVGASLMAAALVAATSATSASAADSCPNVEFRTGAAQYLPDCRAYEMVSPVQKNNGGVGNASNVTGIKAGADGENVMFGAIGAFADAQSLQLSAAYHSGRSETDWATSAIAWRPSQVPFIGVENTAKTVGPLGISADGTKTVYVIDRDPVTNLEIPASAFLVDMHSGEKTRITPDPLLTPGSSWGAGAAGDPAFENVFITSGWSFNSEAAQIPGSGTRLYHYDVANGELSLASWSPDVEGTPISGDLLWNGLFQASNFISLDGQVYYFTSTSSGSNRTLLRGEVGVKKSINVMTAEIPGQDPPATGLGVYQGAATDGDRVFFITNTPLVPEDTNTTNDLYMYDHAKPEGNRLTLLSEDENANTNGGVALRALGNSDDGRVVYFTTQNQIISGEDTSAGNKLYRWEEGEIEFLGRVTASGNIGDAVNVSSDGRFAAFASSFGIAGAQTGSLTQAYLYDHGSGAFSCVSCRPDGSPNQAAAELGAGPVNTIRIDYKPIRFLLDDGRLTFTTADRLLARDTNGVNDVYSYKGGDLQLISSGRDASPSRLGDVSADGSAIFFTTRERLVAKDVDDLVDLYVARVNGGLASSSQDEAECQGADCQGAAPSAPTIAAAATSQAGHGNLREAAPLRIAVRAQRVVNRAATRLRVRVPGAGRVVLSGPGVRRSARRVTRAGVQAVRLRLNRRAVRQLRIRGAFRTRARVVYRGRGGESATARVPVVFRYRGAAR